MPVVTVLGVPQGMSLSDLIRTEKSIIDAVVSIVELNNTPNQVTVFFPALLMTPPTKDVVVFIDLFEKPERTIEVRKLLAQAVGETIRSFCGDVLVECWVRPFDSTKDFWSSALCVKAIPENKALQLANDFLEFG